MPFHQFTLVLLSTALVVACHSAPRADVTGQGALRRYELRGKVIAIDRAGQRMVIAHQAIPGFMAAMTMSYRVKDSAAFNRVAPGQEVTAEVAVSPESLWLEHVVPRSRRP